MRKKLEENANYRAVKLVFDYYKYFMNCDNAKIFGGVTVDYKYITKTVPFTQNIWDYRTQTYIPQTIQVTQQVRDTSVDPDIHIWFYEYKTRDKAAEVERLRNLLLLSPDMELESEANSRYYYKVKYINLSLPSIKDNALGFERKIDDSKGSESGS